MAGGSIGGWLLMLDRLQAQDGKDVPNYSEQALYLWERQEAMERDIQALKNKAKIGGEISFGFRPYPHHEKAKQNLQQFGRHPLGDHVAELFNALERTRKNFLTLDKRLDWILPKGETRVPWGVITRAHDFSVSTPDTQPGQRVWDSDTDVEWFNHAGTWKRVGLIVPRTFYGTGLAISGATFSFVSGMNYSITPAQTVFAIAEAWGSIRGDGVNEAQEQVWINPNPADTQAGPVIGTASVTNIHFWGGVSGTLAAGTAYQIGLQGRALGGGSGVMDTVWVRILYSHPA